MLRVTQLVVVLALFAASTFGQTSVPQFEDFPVKKKYSGKNAPLILTRQDRMYRTILREGARQKPNFAGHYILEAWGCGAACLMGAIIDAKTGKVYWIPHAICCWDEVKRDVEAVPMEYRLDSRLIVFWGLRNESGELGAHYYEFDKTRFKFIRTIKP